MLEIDPKLSVVNGLAAMARLRNNLNEALPLAISLDRATELNSFRGRLLSGHDEVWSLAETPSGRLLSGGRDGMLRLWSPAGQPESPGIPSGHRAGIRGIVAISDQEWWTAGDEANLQHWVGGKPQGPPIATGHGSIQTLVRTRDGHLLSAGTDGLLRRWHATTGQSLGPPLPTGHLEVWSVAILPNGDWVTGGREGRLQWWHQGQRRGLPQASGQGAVTALESLANNGIISGGDDGSVRLWSQDGGLLRTIKSGHSSIFTLLRRNNGRLLSGGSERLAIGPSNYVRIWELKNQLDDHRIQVNQKESLSIVELCNGDLISGGSDGYLYHWRGKHRLGYPIKTPHRRVYALTVLSSGDLVSGGDDGSFVIWRHGQPVSKTISSQGGVSSLSALQDGSFLSGGRDGSIKHWSLKGPIRLKQTIQTRHGAVWAITPLANGDLLTGGDDGTLRRWRRGQQVGAAIKTPHTTVVSLVVKRNGDWVSGGSGGDIQIWRHGKPLGDYFQVASGSVWSLAELRHGDLVSANGDGSLSVYPTPAAAIAKACHQLLLSSQGNEPVDPAEAEALKLCAKS
jgi:WD40 repeat protein